MADNTYVGKIRLPSGATQEVTVQASSSRNALEIVEMQYGKENIWSPPVSK